MKIKNIFAITGVVAGLSLAFAASPLIGEMIATTAPLLITFPHEYLGLKYENVAFPTSDGLTLRGWFFPVDDPLAPAILYAPATAKDQRQGLSLVAPLHDAGYQVLLFSYRGSGMSEGNRLQFSYGARESMDIDAAIRYLTETRAIEHIGAIGHSAGAVSIILSAARNPQLDAIVAAAPFTSLEDIWKDSRPSIFSADFYLQAQNFFQIRKDFSQAEVRPIDVIHKISPRPVLLIFGTDDKRVSEKQAARLFDAAESPKQIIWLKGNNHAEVRSPGLDKLSQQIIDFFDTNLRNNSKSLQTAMNPGIMIHHIPIEN